MSRNKTTQKKRDRARKVQAFLLHQEGKTVREISRIFGDKTPEQVSEMVKIGERWAS